MKRYFRVKTGELHIWKALFSEHERSVENYLKLLSTEELNRARRFHFHRDSQKYIIGRALLRWILGQYTQIKPQDIEFTYNSYGKPFLKNFMGLNFNLAHSHDVIVVALTTGASIGVDVEYIRENLDNEEIAEHYFSKSEAATLRSLPACEKASGFFRCWTRKEAYIKAKEKGLSLPLKQFDVTLSPDDPPRLLRTSFNETKRWNLYNLNPAENYAGAVAIDSPLSNIHYFSI
jgi:4'-phosphopantetheinyl transferase